MPHEPPDPISELLDAVHKFAAAIGRTPKSVIIKLHGGGMVKLPLPLPLYLPPKGITRNDTPVSKSAAPPFSPMESAILDVVAADGWTTTAAIATAIGENPDGDLKAILRNLTARGVLLSAQGKGFRLNAAASDPGATPCPNRPTSSTS